MRYGNCCVGWKTAAIRASALALSMLGSGVAAHSENTAERSPDRIRTATPIKHVIIIVGENRSFDHLFAIYVSRRKHERVLNLLAEGIVNADGSPGRNFYQTRWRDRRPSGILEMGHLRGLRRQHRAACPEQ